VERTVPEWITGLEGLSELIESNLETVDPTLGLDAVSVLARTGRGRTSSLSLEVFSVARVAVGEAI